MLVNSAILGDSEVHGTNVANKRISYEDSSTRKFKKPVEISGANSEDLQVKAVIWEDIVVKNKKFHFSILLRNIGKSIIEVPNRIHGYGYNWTIKKDNGTSVNSWLGNAQDPSEIVRMVRGEVLTYTLELSIDDSGEGEFEVFINNNVQNIRIQYGNLKVEDKLSVKPQNP